MEQQRRFFLLHERLPSAEIPNMLCRVVLNKYLPLENYAPIDQTTLSSSVPPNNTQSSTTTSIIPLPQPSKTLSTSDLIRNLSDTGLKASLASLLGLGTSVSQQQSVALESKEVNRYVLSNSGRCFSKLMQNDNYSAEVKDLLASSANGTGGAGGALLGKKRGYLVTGFLTAKQTKWTFESSASVGVEVNVSVPVVEALTGVPAPIVSSVVPGLQLDPEVGTSVARGRERKREVYVEEEEIFAVAYSVVELRRRSLFGCNTDGHEGKTKSNKVAVLTGPVRVKRRHMVYGGEDSDEEEVGEDEEDEEGVHEEAEGSGFELEILDGVDEVADHDASINL